MKKRICFLTGLLILFVSVSAQECSQELLKEKPGTWKTGQQGQIVNVVPANLVREKQVLANIHKLVSSNYKPKGCQVLYSTVYGKNPEPGEKYISDPYHYTMYVLRYLCDQNSNDKTKFYVDISTPTTVNIVANAIYSLNSLYSVNLPDDHFRGYLKLEGKPVKKDGYYLLEEKVRGDGNLVGKIKEYRWLITYGDTLPFSYVNRKEYLLIQKKRLEKYLKEVPSEKAFMNQYLVNIEKYLKKPEAELMQPAICIWNDEERFNGFVEEGTIGSFTAVKPNLAYYRKNLPQSSPQFFSVVYKISHGDPVFEENIANIKKAVDFGVLRGMLGR